MHDTWTFRDSEYLRINRQLRRYFRRRLPKEEHHDLIAATWTAIIRNYQARGPLVHFAFRVARNLVADRLRKARRRHTFGLDPSPSDQLEAMPVHGPGVETQVTDAEIREVMMNALEIVADPYRDTVALWLEGMDNFEIAAELGVNYHTVRSRLSRARAVLRAELGEAFESYFE